MLRGELKESFIRDMLKPAYLACGLTIEPNEKKLAAFVSKRMRVARAVIIMPQKTKKEYTAGEISAENAEVGNRRRAKNGRHNPINKPINNPINNPTNNPINNPSTTPFTVQNGNARMLANEMLTWQVYIQNCTANGYRPTNA